MFQNPVSEISICQNPVSHTQRSTCSEFGVSSESFPVSFSLYNHVDDVSPSSAVPDVPFVLSAALLHWILSCCASCPAVCSVASLVSLSLAFDLGFFATGGGTLPAFFNDSASLTTFVTEETSSLFCTLVLASGTGLVSITTVLLLLEKIKLAVLEGDLGDLWKSIGDVGACRLRRDGGLSFDLAAVLMRMASCRFMDGEAIMAGGDFFVGEDTVDEDANGATRD